MDHTGDFQDFLALLRAGDRDALQKAYSTYLPSIRLAVRSRLPDDVRSRFDSLDFVQDVWASFLATPQDSHRFEDSRSLLAFLCQVARHKVTDVARRRFRTDREKANLDDVQHVRSAAAGHRVPSPSQQLVVNEEYERIMLQFPAGHRVILQRLREGMEVEEIAQISGVSLSTVHRVVRRLRDLLGGSTP